MNGATNYQTQAFARLAGVTVRTLHHYDRLGLLRPQRRPTQGRGAGYRLYAAADLERLEQIVALKFLGFPLRQIHALLEGEALTLAQALRLQRGLLEQKRRLLERALETLEAAIHNAESATRRGHAPDSAVLRKIIEVIEMQSDANEWTNQYYSEAAKAKIKARQPAFTAEMQAEVSRQWASLIAEVEAALGEDPAGAHAQELAARWSKLVEGFTQGDAEVTAGLRKVWADRAHWPQEMKQKTAAFRPELFAFIEKAKKCNQ